MKPLVRPLALSAARLSGLTEAEIFGRCKERRYAWPRFAVMKVAHEHGRRYRFIGYYLGLDHATVRNGVRRAVEIERKDPAFAALLSQLREEAGQ